MSSPRSAWSIIKMIASGLFLLVLLFSLFDDSPPKELTEKEKAEILIHIMVERDKEIRNGTYVIPK